jgi:hypothetical protein
LPTAHIWEQLPLPKRTQKPKGKMFSCEKAAKAAFFEILKLKKYKDEVTFYTVNNE